MTNTLSVTWQSVEQKQLGIFKRFSNKSKAWYNSLSPHVYTDSKNVKRFKIYIFKLCHVNIYT